MNNKETIRKSTLVGCFYCHRIFGAKSINLERQCISHLVANGSEEPTIYCPHCGIDSLIGDASGFDITPEFLSYMHIHGFCKVAPSK